MNGMTLLSLSICIGLLLGCSAISQKEERQLRAALGTTMTTPQPPITITTRFAGACPYCGVINLSKSCLPSGGTSIRTNIAGVTNVGSIQNWSIAFRCRNCLMQFSDKIDQYLPETKTIRLPLGTE